MIVRHTGHLIEIPRGKFQTAIIGQLLYLCHGIMQASATYTSSTVRQTVLLLRKTVSPGE